jgi:hypothetical protein
MIFLLPLLQSIVARQSQLSMKQARSTDDYYLQQEVAVSL